MGVFTSPHQFIYSYLLKKAFLETCNILDRETGDSFKTAFFDLERFDKKINYNGLNIFLPTDGDLLYIIKMFADIIPEAQEFIYRKPQRKPLWKTRAEYNLIFDESEFFPDPVSKLSGHFKRESKHFLVIPSNPKIATIDPQKLFIRINENTVPYSRVSSDTPFNDNRERVVSYKGSVIPWDSLEIDPPIRQPLSLATNYVFVPEDFTSDQMKEAINLLKN